MVVDSSDVRSHADAQIRNAVKVIGRSEDRRKVFEEIYRGKNSGKTAEEIASATGLEVKAVLTAALVLSRAKIITAEKVNGRLTYKKDSFFLLYRDKIVREVLKGSSKADTKDLVNSQPIAIPHQTKKNKAQNRAKSTIKILFLAANPIDTERVRFEKEAREIEQRIMLAQKKEDLPVVNRGAVRVNDLQLYLNQEKPVIVHFSGHGTNQGEIVLEDNDGNPVVVPPDALARVFQTLKDNVRCVVLNACYSLEQARSINKYIDFVIGMSSSISDNAAIAFSSAFYLALASGRSVKNAFDQGINEIMLLGHNQQENIPQLLSRNNLDAANIFLVHT